MANETSDKSKLTDEFQLLGKNLVGAIRAAWESPERVRLQQDIEDGLQELENTIKSEVENLSHSPAGQQIKGNVDRLGEKISSSDTPEMIRQELVKALQMANTELLNMIDRFRQVENNPEDPENENKNMGQE